MSGFVRISSYKMDQKDLENMHWYFPRIIKALLLMAG